MPLTNASSTLSTRSCRMMRQRVAPIDTRTAISRERSAARARSRFATFAHAINRTNPTAPISDQNRMRICRPMTCSAKGFTVAVIPLFVSGYSVASCAEMLDSSLRDARCS